PTTCGPDWPLIMQVSRRTQRNSSRGVSSPTLRSRTKQKPSLSSAISRQRPAGPLRTSGFDDATRPPVLTGSPNALPDDRHSSLIGGFEMSQDTSVRNLIDSVVANVEAARAVEKPFFH